MRALQPEYGHGISFMESTNINMKGMTETWLAVLHKNCMRFGIRVTGGDMLPLQQTNDIYIGELPTYTNFTLGPTYQCLFCECHHRLHLTAVVDMANVAGTELLPEIQEYSASPRSIYNWHPGKILITKQHRILWNQILNTIAFNNST